MCVQPTWVTSLNGSFFTNRLWVTRSYLTVATAVTATASRSLFLTRSTEKFIRTYIHTCIYIYDVWTAFFLDLIAGSSSVHVLFRFTYIHKPVDKNGGGVQHTQPGHRVVDDGTKQKKRWINKIKKLMERKWCVATQLPPHKHNWFFKKKKKTIELSKK